MTSEICMADKLKSLISGNSPKIKLRKNNPVPLVAINKVYDICSTSYKSTG